MTDVFYLRFTDFKAFGKIPRNPDSENLLQSLVCCDAIDLNNSLVIFISHRWLAGDKTVSHPDSCIDGKWVKYELIVSGVEHILKYLAPDVQNCYLWLDFSCINQDSPNPGLDFRGNMKKIIGICDCIFTPLYDPDYYWEYPADIIPTPPIFQWIQSSAWKGNDFAYMNRGWCRLEMFYAANIPTVDDNPERVEKFRAGLKIGRIQKRRPHVLCASKKEETSEDVPIFFLPSLQYSNFEAYHPVRGCFSVPEDRLIIDQLTRDLLPDIKILEPSFEGDLNGQGRMIYDDGDIYEGEFLNGRAHGEGECYSVRGDFYKGRMKEDLQFGPGVMIFNNGDVYEGNWENGTLNGYGKYSYVSGAVYEGEFVNGKLHGRGELISADRRSILKGEWNQGVLITHQDNNDSSINSQNI